MIIETPVSGSTIGAPLIVRGQIHLDYLPQYELMIDSTPVANFGEAWRRGDSFLFALDVPFLTNGAHTIWARRRGENTGSAQCEVVFLR